MGQIDSRLSSIHHDYLLVPSDKLIVIYALIPDILQKTKTILISGNTQNIRVRISSSIKTTC